MSATEDILNLLRVDRGTKYTTMQLSEALSEHSFSNISASLAGLSKQKKVSRVERPTGKGYFYFLPPDGQPVTVAQPATAPKARTAAAEIPTFRTQKYAALPSELRQAQKPPAAPVLKVAREERESSAATRFAIRDDGALAINEDGRDGVTLENAAVARLFGFLEKTRTLWSAQ